ncbi:MAG: MFS transporter [Oscillospiraceae bacterium]|nr:MFS transporter [Oscillospiraceae bacterium]
MYSLLLAIIYLAFISLGLPDSLLGSAWPVMHTAFQVPISYMGIITMLISGCTVLSSLLSDFLTKKLKNPAVVIISALMTCLALFGFSRATAFWMLVVLAVPYGLGAGSVDAALNNYVATHYSAKHMSWLHCFWGVGAIISPFVMGYALTHSHWNNGYLTISAVQGFIGLVLLLSLPLWKVNKEKAVSTQPEKSIGLVGALKIKGVPFLLLGFFCYCAAEFAALEWASTYLVQARKLPEEMAATFGSLFFIGMTVGRFFGGFIMDRFGDRKMIRMGAAISILGMFLLWLPVQTNVFSLMAFVIIGLGFAPIYPCIIHSTPSNFGAENSGAIIGIQMASAYAGATFMPPIYGLLGKAIGFEIMPFYLLIFIGLMLFMVEKTFRITKNS